MDTDRFDAWREINPDALLADGFEDASLNNWLT
jgi:hypothetical protein